MRHRRSSSESGHERARQHIREAQALSDELGGTDEDVKRYLFSLKGRLLNKVLDEYGRVYGPAKRAYAVEALPHWKSGRRHMSGLVAGRLYSLLPPRMPMETKHSMVEALWEKHGPRSRKVARIGPDVSSVHANHRIREYVVETVRAYQIPSPLERRFRWLSGGDVATYQELLNYFRGREAEQVLDGLAARLPLLLRQMIDYGASTQSLSQTLTIGKHDLKLVFDRAASGISMEDPAVVRRHHPLTTERPGGVRPSPLKRPGSHASYSSSTQGEGYGGCLTIVIIVVILFALGQCS